MGQLIPSSSSSSSLPAALHVACSGHKHERVAFENMGDINIYILPEAAAAAGGEKKVAPGPTREVKSGLVWSGRGRAPSPFTDRLTDAHIRLLTSSPRASEQLRSGNRRQARQGEARASLQNKSLSSTNVLDSSNMKNMNTCTDEND